QRQQVAQSQQAEVKAAPDPIPEPDHGPEVPEEGGEELPGESSSRGVDDELP
ncbi:unnamed protein product, partial [Effrenium voratum]